MNEFIQKVKSKHSSLRAIIHNASDWIPESADMECADIMAKMMQVHVSVPYQINLSLKELLLSSPENLKDIIHFTDFVAEKGSKKHIAYAASKAALANMTLSFAASFAPDVKVNSIAPALVLFNESNNDEYKAKAVKKALIEKEGGLREVISSVDYLLTSTYITGRTLHLDGGRHLK
jgi:dihydromonapterin reductase/dihydrofolate reductase